MPLMIACTFATPLPVGERVLEPDPIQSTRRAEVPDVAEADAVSGAAAFGDLTLGRREPGRCLLRRHGRHAPASCMRIDSSRAATVFSPLSSQKYQAR